MSTKLGFWRCALAGVAMVAFCGSVASARIIEAKGITTIETGAILVYADLELDVDEGIDTRIQLTNTSQFLTRVDCFYLNANSHCGGDGGPVCRTDAECAVDTPGLRCVPGWAKTDFRLTLTKRQPLSWNIGNGLNPLPLSNEPGQNNQFNEGAVPPVPEDPFIGELRCVQKDTGDADRPSDRNDLKGESTFVHMTADGDIDVHKSNAIAIKAIEGAQDGEPNTLNIGGPDPEYGSFPAPGQDGNVGCPNIWTVNHFFEGAPVVTHEGASASAVNTKLTVVPCGVDLLTDVAGGATLQFLIYNEFEQRFSTSTRMDCYLETRLADIDTRPGPDGDSRSIFSVGTQGTLTGMSRVRSVSGPDDNEDNYDGNGVLLHVEEIWGLGMCVGGAAQAANGQTAEAGCSVDSDCPGGGTCMAPASGLAYKSTAANVQFQGSRSQGDQMILP